MKTREEVDFLKQNWKNDPCWDIETTEGFEEYRDELLAYRKECEAAWEELGRKRLQKEIEEAEKLGLVGLLRRIKELEVQSDRQHDAIVCLCDNEGQKAYNALMGRGG